MLEVAPQLIGPLVLSMFSAVLSLLLLWWMNIPGEFDER